MQGKERERENVAGGQGLTGWQVISLSRRLPFQTKRVRPVSSLCAKTSRPANNTLFITDMGLSLHLVALRPYSDIIKTNNLQVLQMMTVDL